jgi:DNA-directed RNA polymerases I, II, and III subunit RPABC3
MSTSTALLEDTFEIIEVDPDGKKFDKVSRLVCRGESYDMDLVLDVHSDLFKVRPQDKFKMMIASTLRLDGAPESDEYEDLRGPSLLEKYQYVMYGQVFRFEHDPSQPMSV